MSDSNSPNYFELPPIYALIIGINNYTNYPKLNSAVKDADDFQHYLTTRLHVPSNHIISLRDSTATHSAIISAFDDLKNITSGQPKDEVAIAVFFAGHGARGEKPKDWVDWVTVGDYYEALCPVDMGAAEIRESEVVDEATGEVKVVKEEGEVPAIPDRTIAALVNRLSETRGNNITLILDCCHSAGATRHSKEAREAENEGYVPRYVATPPPLPPNYDRDITWALSRGTGIAKGFSGKNMSSHVLLAACGKEQFAHEHPKQPNGVFTYALMKVLNEASVEDLTYTSLMHRLNMPKWQNAHCEGAEVDRRLFNHRIEGGDPSFILGMKQGDKLTMDAGIVQGITVGCTVSVHESNLLAIAQQPNPPLGTLVVSEVNNTSSILQLPPDTHSLPLRRMFYCKVTERPSESLIISSNNLTWLESVYTQEFRTAHSITIIPDTSAADFVLTLEEDTVHIDHHFPLAAKHIGTRSPFTVPSHNIWKLHEIVRCAINFRFHLLRTNPDLDNDSSKVKVKMEMKELEMSYNAEYQLVAKSVGRDIFERDPAVVVVEREKRYGVTVDNFTDLPLYPHLFYFDPSELSITPWYLPPTGAGASITSHKVDVVLQPKSEFLIGYYGEGGVDPWEFMLREGETKDVGFFKLFVTTAPVNLGSIAQECPYYAAGTRAGQVSAPPSGESYMEVWDTVVKTVLQLEIGTTI